MPQLDSLTYFTQFFWFIITFVTLYVIVENIILPHIAMILKIRNAMKSKKNELTEKKSNNIEILSSSNLNTIENFTTNVNLNGKNWFNSSLDTIKQEQLYTVNKTYADNIGIILLKKKNKINK